MELPVGGLTSQITVNRDNLSGGTWTAPIKIGPNGNPSQVVLSNPGYTQTAASLGGGSVGLVPFALHDESCAPANGGHAIVTGGSAPVVRLRHYGPLTWTTGLPVTIKSRAACSNDSFVAVNPSPTSQDFALDDDNPNGSDPMRTLVVTYDFQPGQEYEIEPTANLTCEGAAGDPAVAWDAAYTFTVVSQCYADVNGSGVVDVDDLVAVILGWGACASPPAACPTDVVPLPCGNGIADVDDLIAVILSWGLNCATSEYDDVGSMESVEDCMDKASETFTAYSPEWIAMVQQCVQALCEAQIINCD
jgi:hypothetical protein